MKIKYKTVVDERYPDYNAHLPLPSNKQEWCCEELKGAEITRAVEIQNKELFLTEQDPYEGYTTTCSTPVKCCPFCGELVEPEEVKRVKRVLRSKTIRAQPARKEKHWVEIPVKEEI